MKIKSKVKIFFTLITVGIFLAGVQLVSAKVKTKTVEGFEGVIAERYEDSKES